jgi:hypothetical protein
VVEDCGYVGDVLLVVVAGVLGLVVVVVHAPAVVVAPLVFIRS